MILKARAYIFINKMGSSTTILLALRCSFLYYNNFIDKFKGQLQWQNQKSLNPDENSLCEYDRNKIKFRVKILLFD